MRRWFLLVFAGVLLAVVSGSSLAAPTQPAGVNASPAKWNFGRVPIATGSSKVITFTNNTGVTVSIQNGYGVDPTGAPFGFQTIDTCLAVAAGGQCQGMITFAPGEAGHYSGKVYVTFTATGASYQTTIPVSGNGYSPNKPTPF